MAKTSIINVEIDSKINTAYVTYSSGTEKLYPANKLPKTVRAWLEAKAEEEKRNEFLSKREAANLKRDSGLDVIESMTIKEARVRQNLTQPEAAKLLGVPKRTLQDWEDGRREPRQGQDYWIERISALGILTEEGKRCLLEGIWDMEDVLAQYKHSRVQELSSWGRYGATYEANRKRIPTEVWDKLPAEDLAKLVDVIKAAYDDGVTYGRKGE